jgi:recombination protein RecA
MWGGWYDDPELMAELEQKIRENMDKLSNMSKASAKKGIKAPAAPVAPAAPSAPVTKASAKAKLDIAVDD